LGLDDQLRIERRVHSPPTGRFPFDP